MHRKQTQRWRTSPYVVWHCWKATNTLWCHSANAIYILYHCATCSWSQYPNIMPRRWKTAVLKMKLQVLQQELGPQEEAVRPDRADVCWVTVGQDPTFTNRDEFSWNREWRGQGKHHDVNLVLHGPTWPYTSSTVGQNFSVCIWLYLQLCNSGKIMKSHRVIKRMIKYDNKMDQLHCSFQRLGFAFQRISDSFHLLWRLWGHMNHRFASG